MDWRYKALVQSLFSILPAGAELNYAFQRFVTKSLPAPKDKVANKAALAKRHLDLMRPHMQAPLAQTLFYEFGAGADLTIPIAFYALGVERQILVDIRRLARPFLVNATIQHLQSLFPKPLELLPSSEPGFTRTLRSLYGADYQAPCDARHTGFPAACIDCITSTDTLEHVPSQDVGAILAECHRLLRDDGVMSFRIDYGDHFSYFDPHISAYNFLRYPDWYWAPFSQSLHFQNRMRHSDYLHILAQVGFEAIQEFRVEGSPEDLETIQRLPLRPRFRNYDLRDLATKSSVLLLRKAHRH